MKMSKSEYVRKDFQTDLKNDGSIALLLSEVEQVREFKHSDSNSQESTTPSVSCADCVERRRIKDVSELRMGLHIEMQGRSSQCEEANQKRDWLYTHHAIISNIIAISDTGHIVEVELIHMSEHENKPQLCKTCHTFDLKYDELYEIHYLFPKYSPDQIVRRAEESLEKLSRAHESKTGVTFYKFNIFTRNCGHFATWCIVGEEINYESIQWSDQILQPFINFGYSRQVLDWISKTIEALKYLFGHGSKVAQFITKLLHASSDEINEVLRDVIPGWPSSAGKVLFGASGIYTIYCLCTTAYLYYRKSKATICTPCYDEQLANLWARFSMYGATSFVTYFMVHGNVNILNVTGSIRRIGISIACQYYIPSKRKVFMAPYCGSKRKISQLSELEIGDIVNLNYFGLQHYVLITEIHEEKDRKKGKLRAVHYAIDSLFSRRKVKEEYFNVNLNLRWDVKRYECEHLVTFRPEITVKRARKRVGETKWNLVTNRSDHVCYWAKIPQHIKLSKEDTRNVSNVDRGKTDSELLSSLFIGETNVNLNEDIEIGDVVRYRKKERIVVEKSGGEREINLKLASVEGIVKFQNFSINL